ncbi:Arc family DNA-binding protein [Pseudomonas sp. Snoq117.2]|uniref:Arc family DNA-binding protein n=1 Tax=Pseudomonas sp. Snoq117.2 TaxID=1500302 RepID=UPI0008CE6EBF|nr:Arc family DNA-binding protein [Pseudomonas sp. Snoq117.2]SEP40694.1 Arc-like DNA binding domain-containing protein [Pseudomonas sp. Snoq117.2]
MTTATKRKPSVRKSATEDEKFVVRFPKGLRPQIAEAAKQAHRSMNAEIIIRMGRTLELEDEVFRLQRVIDQLLATNDEPSRPAARAAQEIHA